MMFTMSTYLWGHSHTPFYTMSSYFQWYPCTCHNIKVCGPTCPHISHERYCIPISYEFSIPSPYLYTSLDVPRNPWLHYLILYSHWTWGCRYKYQTLLIL